jgi:hypothetical protein
MKPGCRGLVVLCLAACGGSGSASVQGQKAFCYSDTTINGVSQPTCSGAAGLSTDQVQTANTTCTESDGEVVSACPSQSLVGCCQDLHGPNPGQTCYYYGTASDWEAACCVAGECSSGPNDWSTTSF